MFSGSASYESMRQYKMVAREVLAAIPKGRHDIKWSNAKISFGQDDWLENFIRSGRFSIVVEPTINNCKSLECLSM